MSKIVYFVSFILYSSFTLASELQVVVVGHNNQPIEDIVVYIEPVNFTFSHRKMDKIEISQKNKAFTPYINVIQKNQPVLFNNQDEITHHIFSATQQHSFSFKIRSGATNQENLFNEVGNISMGCNIHDWMSGYLLVLDTPFFDKTNQQGLAKFNLNESDIVSENANGNLKAKVKITIWHPQLMEDEMSQFKQIELTTNNQEISFKLTKPLDEIPKQESGEDFDFLDSY